MIKTYFNLQKLGCSPFWGAKDASEYGNAWQALFWQTETPLSMLQATKFTADFVDERIEAFVSWFLEDKVKNLSDEEYAEVVSTLVKMQKQADVTLTEEFDRNW